MGRGYRDNRQAFEDDDMTVKVTSDSFTVEGDGHYCVFSDGSSVLPIQGRPERYISGRHRRNPLLCILGE